MSCCGAVTVGVRLGRAVVAGSGVEPGVDRLRSWLVGVSRQAEAAVVLSDRVAALTSTGVALGGAVRVRVDSAGRLVGLELDESVGRVPAAQLASAVLQAVAAAQRGLNPLVAQVVAETVGVDSQTGQAVVDSFATQYPDLEPDFDPESESESDGRSRWAEDDEDWWGGEPR